MAELTTAHTTANFCCAPAAQATCCEPSAKAECCDPSHGEGCDCTANTPSRCTQATRASGTESSRLASLCSAVTVDSDHGPDRLHDAEGPWSGEEPVYCLSRSTTRLR
jgi:hypothetical protein